MKPILFNFLGFNFSAYLFFVFLGIILASLLFLYLAKKQNFKLLNAVDILLIVMSTWFIGARLFHIIFELPSYYLNNPSQIFYFSKGGFVLYGGIIFVSFCILIYTSLKKISFYKTIDICAPALMLGMAIGRLGCFMQGCCYGKHTNAPWGMVFKKISLQPIHPTQLYMSFFDFLIFIISIKLLKKNKFDGFTGLSTIILYSMFRFFVEFFRADFRGDFYFFSISQYISILIFITALSFLTFKLKKRRS